MLSRTEKGTGNSWGYQMKFNTSKLRWFVY